MLILLTSETKFGTDVLRFVGVLLIFIFVLVVTGLVSKWLAGYTKQQGANNNIEVIETTRIANNEYIQIVRIGEHYKVIALCKDNVTLLGEISEDELKIREMPKALGKSFGEIFHNLKNKNNSGEEQ